MKPRSYNLTLRIISLIVAVAFTFTTLSQDIAYAYQSKVNALNRPLITSEGLEDSPISSEIDNGKIQFFLYTILEVIKDCLKVNPGQKDALVRTLNEKCTAMLSRAQLEGKSTIKFYLEGNLEVRVDISNPDKPVVIHEQKSKEEEKAVALATPIFDIGDVKAENRTGRIQQIKQLLKLIGVFKEKLHKKEGLHRRIRRLFDLEFPQITAISDMHGDIDGFLKLIADEFKRYFNYKGAINLVWDRPLKVQLSEIGLDIDSYHGVFYIAGDFLDRGEHGLKVFKVAKELIELGKARYITGNHDLWAFLNLMGMHLPWYEGYNFYGDNEAQKLVKENGLQTLEWWTNKLAEFDKMQDKIQKGVFEAKSKDIRAFMCNLYKAKDLKELYKILKKKYDKDTLSLWEDLTGFYFGSTDVYTGFRAAGKMSAKWWQERLERAKVVLANTEAGNDEFDKELWQMMYKLTEEATKVVTENLENALKEKKWWYRVLEGINYQNYTSVEWWGKDWSSHKDWGTAVIAELNTIMKEKFDRGEVDELIQYDQSNYIASPLLQELANFYRKNFTLYLMDPYGGLYTHGWLPVDTQTANINFIYKGITYQGRSIFEGLKAIQEDVRSDKPLNEIWEALNLVNSWYADKTTRIKPADIKDYIRKVGIKNIQGQIGVYMWLTFHNTLPSLMEKGLEFMTKDGEYYHFEGDGAMAPRFGGEGKVVKVGPYGPYGIRLRGYATQEAKKENIIMDNPPIYKYETTKDGKEKEIIGEKSQIPDNIEVEKFLEFTSKHLQEELEEISLTLSEDRKISTPLVEPRVSATTDIPKIKPQSNESKPLKKGYKLYDLSIVAMIGVGLLYYAPAAVGMLAILCGMGIFAYLSCKALKKQKFLHLLVFAGLTAMLLFLQGKVLHHTLAERPIPPQPPISTQLKDTSYKDINSKLKALQVVPTVKATPLVNKSYAGRIYAFYGGHQAATDFERYAETIKTLLTEEKIDPKDVIVFTEYSSSPFLRNRPSVKDGNTKENRDALEKEYQRLQDGLDYIQKEGFVVDPFYALTHIKLLEFLASKKIKVIAERPDIESALQWIEMEEHSRLSNELFAKGDLEGTLREGRLAIDAAVKSIRLRNASRLEQLQSLRDANPGKVIISTCGSLHKGELNGISGASARVMPESTKMGFLESLIEARLKGKALADENIRIKLGYLASALNVLMLERITDPNKAKLEAEKILSVLIQDKGIEKEVKRLAQDISKDPANNRVIIINWLYRQQKRIGADKLNLDVPKPSKSSKGYTVYDLSIPFIGFFVLLYYAPAITGILAAVVLVGFLRNIFHKGLKATTYNVSDIKQERLRPLKILLIQPRQANQNQLPTGFPLRLLMLASALRNKTYIRSLMTRLNKQEFIRDDYPNFEVEILDLETKSGEFNDPVVLTQYLKEYILQSKPDILGVTSITSTFPQVQLIAEVAGSVEEDLKKNNPNYKMVKVIGGVHSTIMPDEVLNNSNFDLAIAGEGEEAFTELVLELATDKPQLENVRGVIYRGQKEFRPNLPIRDLDSLPFACESLDLLDLHNYDTTVNIGGKLYGPAVSIYLSRGCPFDCSICAAKRLNPKRAVRARSAKNLFEEMKMYYYKYGYQIFLFSDDDFTINKKIVNEFCDLIINEGMEIEWTIMTRADLLNGDSYASEELLKKMKKAGCVTIAFGVESGDQHLLDKEIKKHLDLNEVEKVTNLLKSIGINVKYFMLVGHPGQTWDSVEKSLDFIVNNLPDFVNVSFVIPYPGTRLYEDKRIQFVSAERFTEYLLTSMKEGDGNLEFGQEEIEGFKSLLEKTNSMKLWDYRINVLLSDFINNAIGKDTLIRNIGILLYLFYTHEPEQQVRYVEFPRTTTKIYDESGEILMSSEDITVARRILIDAFKATSPFVDRHKELLRQLNEGTIEKDTFEKEAKDLKLYLSEKVKPLKKNILQMKQRLPDKETPKAISSIASYQTLGLLIGGLGLASIIGLGMGAVIGCALFTKGIIFVLSIAANLLFQAQILKKVEETLLTTQPGRAGPAIVASTKEGQIYIEEDVLKNAYPDTYQFIKYLYILPHEIVHVITHFISILVKPLVDRIPQPIKSSKPYKFLRYLANGLEEHIANIIGVLPLTGLIITAVYLAGLALTNASNHMLTYAVPLYTKDGRGNSDLAELLKKASGYYDKGNYKDAEKILKSILPKVKLSRNLELEIEIRLLYVVTLIAKGDYTAAINLAEKSMTELKKKFDLSEEDLAAFVLYMSKAYLFRHEKSGDDEDYRRAVKNIRESTAYITLSGNAHLLSQLYYLTGKISLKEGKFDLTFDFYLESELTTASDYKELGAAILNKAKHKDITPEEIYIAFSAFEKAKVTLIFHNLKAELKNVHWLIGDLYNYLHRHPEICNDLNFDRILDFNPRLGNFLENAIVAWEKAIFEGIPMRPTVFPTIEEHRQIINSYIELKKYNSAIEYIEGFIEKIPMFKKLSSGKPKLVLEPELNLELLKVFAIKAQQKEGLTMPELAGAFSIINKFYDSMQRYFRPSKIALQNLDRWVGLVLLYAGKKAVMNEINVRDIVSDFIVGPQDKSNIGQILLKKSCEIFEAVIERSDKDRDPALLKIKDYENLRKAYKEYLGTNPDDASQIRARLNLITPQEDTSVKALVKLEDGPTLYDLVEKQILNANYWKDADPVKLTRDLKNSVTFLINADKGIPPASLQGFIKILRSLVAASQAIFAHHDLDFAFSSLKDIASEERFANLEKATEKEQSLNRKIAGWVEYLKAKKYLLRFKEKKDSKALLDAQGSLYRASDILSGNTALINEIKSDLRYLEINISIEEGRQILKKLEIGIRSDATLLEAAKEVITKLERLSEEITDKVLLGYIFKVLGKLYLGMADKEEESRNGNLRKALENFEKAYGILPVKALDPELKGLIGDLEWRLKGKKSAANFVNSIIRLLSERVKLEGEGLYVSAMDVDYLRRINDLYGKPIVNKVLEIINEVIERELAGTEEHVYANYYFAGDESNISFAIDLAKLGDKALTDKDVFDILNKIGQAVVDKFDKKYAVAVLDLSGIEGTNYKKAIDIIRQNSLALNERGRSKGNLILFEVDEGTTPLEALTKLLDKINNELANLGMARLNTENLEERFKWFRDPDAEESYSEFNEGYLWTPTISIGGVSAKDVLKERWGTFDKLSEKETERAIKTWVSRAIYRAEDAMRAAKEQRNAVKVGLFKEHIHKLIKPIIADDTLEGLKKALEGYTYSDDTDYLDPRLLSRQYFRRKVYNDVKKEGAKGVIIQLNPVYNEKFNLRDINDIYGHTGGDHTLKLQSDKILEELYRDDRFIWSNGKKSNFYIARYGDNFQIYIEIEGEQLPNDEEIASQIANFIDSIQQKVNLDLTDEAKISKIKLSFATTKDLKSPGLLFARVEDTAFCKEGARPLITDAQNEIKIYTSSVDKESIEIDERRAYEAGRFLEDNGRSSQAKHPVTSKVSYLMAGLLIGGIGLASIIGLGIGTIIGCALFTKGIIFVLSIAANLLFQAQILKKPEALLSSHSGRSPPFVAYTKEGRIHIEEDVLKKTYPNPVIYFIIKYLYILPHEYVHVIIHFISRLVKPLVNRIPQPIKSSKPYKLLQYLANGLEESIATVIGVLPVTVLVAGGLYIVGLYVAKFVSHLSFAGITSFKNNKEANQAKKKLSWIKKNAPLVADKTVVSFQMEMGLPPDVLDRFREERYQRYLDPQEIDKELERRSLHQEQLIEGLQGLLRKGHSFEEVMRMLESRSSTESQDLLKQIGSLLRLRELLDKEDSIEGKAMLLANTDTSQIAQLTMSGGLGALMPDLVRGWADNGCDTIAINPLYSKWIKGVGHVEGGYVDSLKSVLDNTGIEFKVKVMDIRFVRGEPTPVGEKEVNVKVFAAKLGSSRVYYLDCPEIFDGLYPDNDYLRTNQMLLYRRAGLELLKRLKGEGETKEGFVFVENEIYTGIINPKVIKDEYQKDKDFDDVFIHHINHTVTPAGMPLFEGCLFDMLDIDDRFRKGIVRDGKIHFADLCGITADIITGVSRKHTRVLKNKVMPKYKDKIVEDFNIGNTNGAHRLHWQDKKIRQLVDLYMKKLKIKPDDYIGFFAALEKKSNLQLQEEFINKLSVVKEKNSQIFVQWLKNRGIHINEGCAIATMTRRVVEYKAIPKLIKLLEDEKFRERFRKSNVVIIFGGRTFDATAVAWLNEIISIAARHGLSDRIAHLPSYNIADAPNLFKGVDATVMIAREDEEASATSMMKGLLNGAGMIASLDGAIPELMKEFDFKKGKGNGFIVDYATDDMPDVESLLVAFENLGKLHQDKNLFKKYIYTSLKTGLTKCDITTTQARGTALLWQNGLDRREGEFKPQLLKDKDPFKIIKPSILTKDIFTLIRKDWKISQEEWKEYFRFLTDLEKSKDDQISEGDVIRDLKALIKVIKGVDDKFIASKAIRILSHRISWLDISEDILEERIEILKKDSKVNGKDIKLIQRRLHLIKTLRQKAQFKKVYDEALSILIESLSNPEDLVRGVTAEELGKFVDRRVEDSLRFRIALERNEWVCQRIEASMRRIKLLKDITIREAQVHWTSGLDIPQEDHHLAIGEKTVIKFSVYIPGVEPVGPMVIGDDWAALIDNKARQARIDWATSIANKACQARICFVNLDKGEDLDAILPNMPLHSKKMRFLHFSGDYENDYTFGTGLSFGSDGRWAVKVMFRLGTDADWKEIGRTQFFVGKAAREKITSVYATDISGEDIAGRDISPEDFPDLPTAIEYLIRRQSIIDEFIQDVGAIKNQWLGNLLLKFVPSRAKKYLRTEDKKRKCFLCFENMPGNEMWIPWDRDSLRIYAQRYPYFELGIIIGLSGTDEQRRNGIHPLQNIEDTEQIKDIIDISKELGPFGYVINFNSKDAGARVEHLHVTAALRPLKAMSCQTANRLVVEETDSVVVAELMDHRVDGFVFYGMDDEVVSKEVLSYINKIQELGLVYNIMTFWEDGKSVIYLFARKPNKYIAGAEVSGVIIGDTWQDVVHRSKINEFIDRVKSVDPEMPIDVIVDTLVDSWNYYITPLSIDRDEFIWLQRIEKFDEARLRDVVDKGYAKKHNLFENPDRLSYSEEIPLYEGEDLLRFRLGIALLKKRMGEKISIIKADTDLEDELTEFAMDRSVEPVVGILHPNLKVGEVAPLEVITEPSPTRNITQLPTAGLAKEGFVGSFKAVMGMAVFELLRSGVRKLASEIARLWVCSQGRWNIRFIADERSVTRGIEKAFKAGEVLGRGKDKNYMVVDTIDGTGSVITNHTKPNLPGGVSIAVSGDGVKSLRGFSKGFSNRNAYANMIVTSIPRAVVPDFQKKPLDPDAPTEETLQRIVDAKRIEDPDFTISDIEVVILNRPREENRINELNELRHLGVSVRIIDEGTFMPALLAGLGGELEKNKHLVFLSTSGVSEALLNLVSLRPFEKQGAFAGFRIYPSEKDFISSRGKDLKDIKKGRTFLTLSDVKGNVDGSYTFITDNITFKYPGTKVRRDGNIEMYTLRIKEVGGVGYRWVEKTIVPQKVIPNTVSQNYISNSSNTKSSSMNTFPPRRKPNPAIHLKSDMPDESRQKSSLPMIYSIIRAIIITGSFFLVSLFIFKAILPATMIVGGLIFTLFIFKYNFYNLIKLFIGKLSLKDFIKGYDIAKVKFTDTWQGLFPRMVEGIKGYPKPVQKFIIGHEFYHINTKEFYHTSTPSSWLDELKADLWGIEFAFLMPDEIKIDDLKNKEILEDILLSPVEVIKRVNLEIEKINQELIAAKDNVVRKGSHYYTDKKLQHADFYRRLLKSYDRKANAHSKLGEFGLALDDLREAKRCASALENADNIISDINKIMEKIYAKKSNLRKPGSAIRLKGIMPIESEENGPHGEVLSSLLAKSDTSAYSIQRARDNKGDIEYVPVRKDTEFDKLIRPNIAPDVNIIVVHGLREALKNARAPDGTIIDLSDIICHPGYKRNSIYIDEEDYTDLKKSNPQALIEALQHEITHLQYPIEKVREILGRNIDEMEYERWIEDKSSTANVRSLIVKIIEVRAEVEQLQEQGIEIKLGMIHDKYRDLWEKLGELNLRYFLKGPDLTNEAIVVREVKKWLLERKAANLPAYLSDLHGDRRPLWDAMKAFNLKDELFPKETASDKAITKESTKRDLSTEESVKNEFVIWKKKIEKDGKKPTPTLLHNSDRPLHDAVKKFNLKEELFGKRNVPFGKRDAAATLALEVLNSEPTEEVRPTSTGRLFPDDLDDSTLGKIKESFERGTTIVQAKRVRPIEPIREDKEILDETESIELVSEKQEPVLDSEEASPSKTEEDKTAEPIVSEVDWVSTLASVTKEIELTPQELKEKLLIEEAVKENFGIISVGLATRLQNRGFNVKPEDVNNFLLRYFKPGEREKISKKCIKASLEKNNFDIEETVKEVKEAIGLSEKTTRQIVEKVYKKLPLFKAILNAIELSNLGDADKLELTNQIEPITKAIANLKLERAPPLVYILNVDNLTQADIEEQLKKVNEVDAVLLAGDFLKAREVYYTILRSLDEKDSDAIKNKIFCTKGLVDDIPEEFNDQINSYDSILVSFSDIAFRKVIEVAGEKVFLEYANYKNEADMEELSKRIIETEEKNKTLVGNAEEFIQGCPSSANPRSIIAKSKNGYVRGSISIAIVVVEDAMGLPDKYSDMVLAHEPGPERNSMVCFWVVGTGEGSKQLGEELVMAAAGLAVELGLRSAYPYSRPVGYSGLLLSDYGKNFKERYGREISIFEYPFVLAKKVKDEEGKSKVIPIGIEPFLDWLKDRAPLLYSKITKDYNGTMITNPDVIPQYLDNIETQFLRFLKQNKENYFGYDRVIRGFHTALGARVVRIIPDARPKDFVSGGHVVVLEYRLKDCVEQAARNIAMDLREIINAAENKDWDKALKFIERLKGNINERIGEINDELAKGDLPDYKKTLLEDELSLLLTLSREAILKYEIINKFTPIVGNINLIKLLKDNEAQELEVQKLENKIKETAEEIKKISDLLERIGEPKFINVEASNEMYRVIDLELSATKESTTVGTIQSVDEEKLEATILATKLCTPLKAKDPQMAERFLRGGYGQDGYGVCEGAAIDGSHTLEGNQGYYAEGGKEVFLNVVAQMKEFFQRRERKIGKPIRYIIKPGIGGQHTPFQGIASGFEVIDTQTAKVVGEYELGKDFETEMARILAKDNADWDQVAVIPSSKSGSTDETMMIFVELLCILLKHIASNKGIDGKGFADIVLDTLHEINFVDGKERSGRDLFKLDKDRFGTDSLINLISNRARDLNISPDEVREILGIVLGNMFFETTDRPQESRLSAFIRNSGLDKELGEDVSGFGAMFDNVGGRWTADLHMMTFLTYHNLDAQTYWNIRNEGIRKVREGEHTANKLGNKIVDEKITDIAVVVPDYLFWFGKSIEQNFNESIWQDGFANLVAIKQSHWNEQRHRYENSPNKLVINITSISIPEDIFNVAKLDVPDFSQLDKQELANTLANLFTLFYGITNTVANRLIVRALKEEGFRVSDVDLNNLDNPATKIVQGNLYLRQPYVELGKGLLEKRLKDLQQEETTNPGAIQRELERIRQAARKRTLQTNINSLGTTSEFSDIKELADVIRKAIEFAEADGRKFVPFIYLEADKFHKLRDYLMFLGIEWVMQGTGDQHISYQQILAQPKKYLPFIISLVPERPQVGRPAIGFAKGYLHNISPHMVRDFFAEASYQALTELRAFCGGLGIFVRMIDSDSNVDILKQAMKQAVKKDNTLYKGIKEIAEDTSEELKDILKAARDIAMDLREIINVAEDKDWSNVQKLIKEFSENIKDRASEIKERLKMEGLPESEREILEDEFSLLYTLTTGSTGGHNIDCVLGAISGFAESIEMKTEDENNPEVANVIEKSAQRLEGIANLLADMKEPIFELIEGNRLINLRLSTTVTSEKDVKEAIKDSVIRSDEETPIEPIEADQRIMEIQV